MGLELSRQFCPLDGKKCHKFLPQNVRGSKRFF